MSKLTPALAAEIVAACEAGATEASAALHTALDADVKLGPAKQSPYSPQQAPAGFDGPGLIVLLAFDGVGLAIAMPESSGMLPEWYAAPDATGESKLSTLAQELGKLVVPPTLAADKFEARRVESISQALAAAGASAEAVLVSVAATSGTNTGTLGIVWPLAAPTAVFAPATGQSQVPSQTSPPASDRNDAGAGHGQRSFTGLPHYSRSLLKIRLPVSVQLATKRETVQDVVELVPGAIIKFDKGCDELLQMVIGGQTVAEGEAVKIGDKFGFRVTGMVMPREHFVSARRPRSA